MTNPYLPKKARIAAIDVETASADVRTFRVEFLAQQDQEEFQYRPGQFAELTVFEVGEAPISITSSPTQKGYLEFSVKNAGLVTGALHQSTVGDIIGVRGPYGNTFPVADMEGKKLLFIGGGIGLAPLRSLITYVLDDEHRKKFVDVAIIYGARSPGDLVFKGELEKWASKPDTNVVVTVDRGDEDWTGKVGFVPAVLKEMNPSAEGTIAITCGPPIMIKFVLEDLARLGFTQEQIVTTLEMRMKCGIGKCGRCNIGQHYVCRDGPVFTLADLHRMPDEY